MIKMLFEKQNQFFIITIEKKIIKYWDKANGTLWGGPLQYLPPDYSNNIKKINSSRNKIPYFFIDLLKVTEEELKEFEKAKNDNELSDIVLRDAKINQCKLIKIELLK